MKKEEMETLRNNHLSILRFAASAGNAKKRGRNIEQF